MQAIVQDAYGTAAVLHARDIDKPVIGDDEILIRVRAAGVNIADWAIMSGLPYIARPVYGLIRPKNSVRGTDVAGIVEAVGAGVTRFVAGDEVFGWANGSYAEYSVSSEESLALKPANLTFEAAAAVPMAGLVALQALRDHANVGPGTTVLVNGASGGIGTFAVQIAKALGAEVTAVTSTRNVELVRSIGADHVIDYTKVDITRTGVRYDWVLDTDSHHSILAMRRCLRPDGVYVTLGGTTWPLLGALVLGPLIGLASRQSMGLMLWWHPFDPTDVTAVAQLVADGTVRPAIDRRYPLDEVVDALRWVHEGEAKGKVLVMMREEGSANG
jgi:NADPH:quinone reductase-like Zn-dependent oxidoreductase